MKIALITDIHFGVRGDNLFFHNNLFQFIEEVFLPTLKKNNITTLFILGDTWDKRKIINFNTLSDVKKRFFNPLWEMGIEIKMLIGNHDVFYKNTNEINSVDLLLESYSNIEIIDFHKEFKLGGRSIGMISWLNPFNIEEGKEWIKNLNVDVLFGHFEINGFGDYEGGFPASLFDHIDLVISGHYHIPSRNGNIIYLGNPNQTNWSEYGQSRGAWLLDTETMGLDLILNPFDVYMKYYYEEDTIDLLKFDYSIFNDKIVKLFVNSFELLNRKKFDLFVDAISKESYNFEVVEIDTNLYQNEQKLDSSSFDVLTHITQYIDAITADNINKSRLYTYFVNIHQQANEMNASLLK